MKWFDEQVVAELGTDEQARHARGYDDIARIADAVLDGEHTPTFVREFFLTQKRAADFVGVGESTMAGWLKKGECPAYAKRAMLAAYYVSKHWQALNNARRDAEHPKVIKDGDTYMVVRFGTDAWGSTTGDVLARDIPSEKVARVFASSERAWELAAALEDAVTDAYFIGFDIGEDDDNDVEPERSKALRETFRIERLRAFDPEKLQEHIEEEARSGREASERLADVEIEL